MLDYEKLDVYQCSLEHLSFVFVTLPKLPKGFSALADQWRRASMSIPMNIAEGVGKSGQADKANRFVIARGEAMECGAILDVVRLLGVVPEGERARAKMLIVRLVEMLTKLGR